MASPHRFVFTPHRRRGTAGTPRAFSLIELTFVVATVAVLAAIGIPKYSQAVNRYRVDLAAKRVLADLALARSTARASGLGQVVNFAAPANGYTIAGVRDRDGRAGNYVVRLADEPYKVTLSSVAFGTMTPAATSVRFTRFGTPEVGGTLVVSSGGYSKTVALDPVSGLAEVR